MKYAKLFNKKSTHQSRPIPGAGQVPNSAGGYAWSVDRWTLLDRFLILGSEDGTYYIGERKLTEDNAKNAIACIQEDGLRAVQRIVEISREGRAPKNDPAIFALALAASFGDDRSRGAAFMALSQVCRTGTHLFAFASAVDGMRGWGRGLRRAVAGWYNSKDPRGLEYQAVKYAQREGWSHRDLLRLAHPVPSTEEHKVLYKWIVDSEVTGSLPLVEAVGRLKNASAAEAVEMIRELKIPREAVPTEMLRQAKVWEALLAEMPLTAMLRNLGNLSKSGLLVANSEAAAKVVAELGDVERLKKARIHPIAVLATLNTYASGRGVRGGGEWAAVASVVDALDRAFYSSFASAESTGKRMLLGLDVSGSMAGTSVAGLAGMDCRKAAGAMALVSLATEPSTQCIAFDTKPYPLTLSARQRLDDVLKVLERTGGGGTDCAAPIDWAIRKKVEVDAFVIYTDSETWYGREHPAQAIQRYRKTMGVSAKLVVVAMASNRYTVADPGDAGTLNVVGFDAAVPQVIAEFLRA